MSIFNTNAQGRYRYDFNTTPHETVASQHYELFISTTNRLDALSAVKRLYDAALSMKSTYESLFNPNIYNRTDNLHRIACNLMPTQLANAIEATETLEAHPHYHTPDFVVAQHMVKQCRILCANVTELLSLVGDMEILDADKHEYNLHDITMLLRSRTDFELRNNTLRDVYCDEKSPSKHIFRYEITVRNKVQTSYTIVYYTPYPMHEIEKVDNYIKEQGVANLPCYKIEKR